MKKFLLSLFFVYLFQLSVASFSGPILVCSAENFYGNVAELIGGKYVKVTSILSNPNADPHLFGISPAIAVAVTKAQVVVYNGADYDPWMFQLLASQPCNNKLAVINVAELMGIKAGENPHIWYYPQTFPRLAKTFAEKFCSIQPKNSAYFKSNLESFNNRYKRVFSLIDNMSEHSGTSVIATESVFDYMIKECKLNLKESKFQQIVMKGGEPSPKIVANFVDQIKNKKVKILFYNSQVTNQTIRHILIMAKENGIPIVGISETMPSNGNVIDWIVSQLKNTQEALNLSRK